jgi:hypothetical protein
MKKLNIMYNPSDLNPWNLIDVSEYKKENIDLDVFIDTLTFYQN